MKAFQFLAWATLLLAVPVALVAADQSNKINPAITAARRAGKRNAR